MRSLLALLAFTLSGFAAAADSNTTQLRDARDLVLICSVDPGDPSYPNAIGFCHGIVVGAFRYHESVAAAGGKRLVCAPNPTPTRAKVMNDFVAWAGANPQYLKDPAVDTLFRYLAMTYPCKK